MFKILKLKKLPIYDLFIQSAEGWQGWSRVSYFQDVLKILDGRKLSTHEKQEVVKELNG